MTPRTLDVAGVSAGLRNLSSAYLRLAEAARQAANAMNQLTSAWDQNKG